MPDFLNASVKLPTSNATLPTTEGAAAWRTTRKVLNLYDGSRERGIGEVGWAPYAFVLGLTAQTNTSATTTLAANGGTMVAPMHVTGHMLLRSLTWRNADTASARSMEWRLYEDRNNASNSLDEIAGANGSESYTASAASTRVVAATTQPTYLAPGIYWLAIRNTHATSTLGVSIVATGTLLATISQTKTLGSALGSTLDVVAATWIKASSGPVAELHGQVAGQAVVF
jgi:hypothetical protein